MTDHERVPLDAPLPHGHRHKPLQVPEADPAPEVYEHKMTLPCGCPIDADCDGRHPGALGVASGIDP